MIVQPKVRGFICTTAHPKGCAHHVQQDIDYVRTQPPIKNGPKKVLVIGSSTGYGLASRIVAAFGGSKAATIGVFYERPAENDKRTATAGWYNSVGFENAAHQEGIYAKSFNGDAFSEEMKEQVAATIKKDWGQVDLVIYSVAAPRRQDPKTGEISKSILRPIGQSYTNKSIDVSKNLLETVTLPPATDEQVEQTVKVMGGEDWALWIERLQRDGLLADGARTVAYSYIGPEVTQAVYRNGTIGRAKDHLEATASTLNERLQSINGQALISVNKALVTQSSSAIPFIPLYFIILKKVMREKKLDEDCSAQMYRLFAEHLYNGKSPTVDEQGFIRMDNLEMLDEVQVGVNKIWDMISNDNLDQQTDLDGYHKDFLNMFGFAVDGVDYTEDVPIDLKLPSAE